MLIVQIVMLQVEFCEIKKHHEYEHIYIPINSSVAEGVLIPFANGTKTADGRSELGEMSRNEHFSSCDTASCSWFWCCLCGSCQLNDNEHSLTLNNHIRTNLYAMTMLDSKTRLILTHHIHCTRDKSFRFTGCLFVFYGVCDVLTCSYIRECSWYGVCLGAINN